MSAIAAARHTPVVQPATLDRSSLSIYLGRSLPALDRDLSGGRIPPGFRLGRSRRWLRSEIDAWLQAGAPEAAQWEGLKAAGRRGK
jgi:predicted DNA-binding transcriptional regulator AlpA